MSEEAKYAGTDFDSLPKMEVAAGPKSGSAAYTGMDFDKIPTKEDKYGTTAQTALAATEGALRGATFGLSDVAETKLLPKIVPESLKEYLPTAETVKARMEANPIASTLGNIGGAGAMLAATGGLGAAGFLGKAAATEAGALAKIGHAAMVNAYQGGALGAGAAVTDYALEDPNLSWQKVAAHIGAGAALGGAFGGGLTAAGTAAPVVLSAAGKGVGSVSKAAKKLFGKAEEAIEKAALPELEGPLGEMAARQKAANYSGVNSGAPQAAELNDALSRYQLDPPLNVFQQEALQSKQQWDAYQALKTKSPVADLFNSEEAIQKAQTLNDTTSSIKAIAGPKVEITDSAMKNGEIASEYFSKAYQAERAEAGKFVGEAKQLNTKGINHLNGVVEAFTDSMPELTKVIKVGESGVELKPYDTSMGLTRQTYKAVSGAIDGLKKNPEDFQSLFNIRKNLENGVTMSSTDKSTIGEISKLKSTMMDYMQKIVGDTSPNLREPFKRYAINESNGNVMKKAFGIDIGDSYESVLNDIRRAPEKIADKIFKNTESVAAAKSMLPKEQFDHVLANWLSENMASFRKGTSEFGEFSGTKWDSFLKKNKDVLEAAFVDRPGELQRIKDIGTTMRALPDAPPINPSGTAKTHGLLEEIKQNFGDVKGSVELAIKAGKFIKDKAVGKFLQDLELKRLNAKLSGKEAMYSVGEQIGDMIKKTSDKIASKAKGIFNGHGEKAVIGTIPSILHDHYDKNSEKVKDLSSNPDKLMDLVSKNELLHEALPQIATSMSAHMTTAVNFLSSKLPRPNNELPFGRKWEPSPSQKSKFNRYFAAINDPVDVLSQVKSGMLTNEAMEALRIVHPDLLKDMQLNVLNNLTDKKVTGLPYNTKISLSKFLGMPLTTNMLPGVAAANQAAYASPQGQPSLGGGKSTASGLSKLSVGQLARTRSQYLERERN